LAQGTAVLPDARVADPFRRITDSDGDDSDDLMHERGFCSRLSRLGRAARSAAWRGFAAPP
jgi:hypothetical protein